MSIAVLIVAAGRGTRLGADRPKQYVSVGGVPIVRRTVEAFLRLDRIAMVRVVIHADDADLYEAALDGVTDPRLAAPVVGGATRALSVRNGLEALVSDAPSRVLIHDAARPFVPAAVVAQTLHALDHSDGAFAALPVVDALWRGEDGHAVAPVPREGLWRAQTPQGFHFDAILQAHRTHDGTGQDDVAVARQAGLRVAMVLGSERNFKVTTQADLDRAERDLGKDVFDEPRLS